MSIALVNHTKISGANGGTTPAVNMTGANFLVALVSQYDGSTLTPPTDSLGNVWTGLTGQDSTVEPYARLFYVKNATVGAAQTFAVSNTIIFATLCVAGFSGVDISSPFDVQNGAISASNTATIATGSVTPSVNNELVIAGVSAGPNNDQFSINSGFTISDSTVYGAGNNEGGALAYLVQTTAAAIDPTWTISSTQANNAAAVIATFKATSGAVVDDRAFAGGAVEVIVLMRDLVGGLLSRIRALRRARIAAAAATGRLATDTG